MREALGAMERMLAAGRHAELEATARQWIKRYPSNGHFRYMLGLSHLARSQWSAAMHELERAAQLLPENAQFLDHLGIAQSFSSRASAARESFRRSLALDPARVSTLVNLAKLQNASKDYEEAEHLARSALQIRPGFKPAQLCLAQSLAGQSRSEEALALLQEVETTAPDDFDLLFEIGRVNQLLGDYSCAVDTFRRALAIRPDEHQLWSHYLFNLSNDERASPEQVFEEHRKFGERVERGYRAAWGGWTRSRNPDRPLVVGILSGDLRSHVVSYFLEPVLEKIDRSQLVLNAYYSHPKADATSERLRRHFALWRDVAYSGDDELAQTIRSDGVDILIDLSGHTDFNRLPVLARKPAPLQVSMLGYPNTTGLTAIDYRLADSVAAPPGRMDGLFTEHILTAPVITSFRHPTDAPSVSALPALRNGYPTFASFNRVAKIGDRMLRLWSAILAAVPGSRLIIGNVRLGTVKESLAARLAALGVERERMSFCPNVPLQDYLATHGEVDVLLDSFPYNGGTTTEHALWMGVPVVSLAGPALPSRLGASILGRVGLGDWVVDTEVDYVARAVAAVSDRDRLAALRQSLRARCADSPLRDPATAARCVEAALRRVWENWCEGAPPGRIDVKPESVGISLSAEIATSCRVAASKGW